MTMRRLLVTLLSLLALLCVCVRAPALDVVRRAAGSLEAVTIRRHERPTALEKPTELARVRVRVARATDADAERDPSSFAILSSHARLAIAASVPADSRAPHCASWVEPSPTHADLMVFLN